MVIFQTFQIQRWYNIENLNNNRRKINYISNFHDVEISTSAYKGKRSKSVTTYIFEKL